MAVHLFVAPAAFGKTAYVLDRARMVSRNLEGVARIVVPTHLQVRALRRRLAETGGSIGIRILTFDQLVAECLNMVDEMYTELSPFVRYRLLRVVVDRLSQEDASTLRYYSPLVARPGFIRAMEEIISEMKAGMILPEHFAQAVAKSGNIPRLREIANIYAAYQRRLQEKNWADREELFWLAVETLKHHPELAGNWPWLAVDGFDDLTPAQLALLGLLAERVGEMVVTLTGDNVGKERPLVHHRFQRTCERLGKMLDVKAEPLPDLSPPVSSPFRYLESHLFCANAVPTDAGNAIELLETSDRASEVRAALRWLKARIIQDGMRPEEVALLARNVQPYRPFILQTAAEFGLPIRLVDGLPLRSNPAVVAILDLLRIMLPISGENPEPALLPRLVVEAWRSPYFNWSALGIRPWDADALDAVARWGRVIAGLSQWKEALQKLVKVSTTIADETGEEDEDAPTIPRRLPRGDHARRLQDCFDRFVQYMSPPAEKSYREFVGWLENLIGPDPALQHSRSAILQGSPSLQVVRQVRRANDASMERDIAALQALKDVLRGLVWAEEALGTAPADFPDFFRELVGMVESATYHLPARGERQEILVADVVQARGLSFRAVALMGLAEGEFPATLTEDPFLKDADREQLRNLGILLNPSTESAEAEFFYEAVTRARERLLLTRPCLADTGAPWAPSPFWEEIRRHIRVEPRKDCPSLHQAASWPELLESLAGQKDVATNEAWKWAIREDNEKRPLAIESAREILHQRQAGQGQAGGPYNGNLESLADKLAQEFGPDYLWSASRLETYQSCPFHFFVAYVLGLEPRPAPTEGLDMRQLGSIYHRLLAKTYQVAHDPMRAESLLATLEQVAGEILDEAPEKEGFRETAWWQETRKEILETTRRTLEELANQGGFTPRHYEIPFGMEDKPPLVIRNELGDEFRLRGKIDRVDIGEEGKARVIDYKTSGPSSYTGSAQKEGKKLQLFLYAKAVEDALQLGEVVEGFYWHIRDCKPSLELSKHGSRKAIEEAIGHSWNVVKGAREGHFEPSAPPEGCPDYCPAALFCWHYRPTYW
jgi:ATP-dependent helicase/nuclease subunit B